jgi:hypothetical protein
MASDRWEGGLVFHPENCQQPGVWNPCPWCHPAIFTVVVCASSGTWEITWDGNTTGPLAFNITAAALTTAVQTLADTVAGAGELEVFVMGGTGNAAGSTPYVITISGDAIDALCDGTPLPFPLDIAAVTITLAGGTCGEPVTGELTQTPGLYEDPKSAAEPTEDVFYDPPVLEIPYTCTTYSRLDFDEYRRRALENLEVGKSKALEYELWTGARVPTNPSLVGSTPNDNDHILNPGGAAAPIAVPPGIALMLLAQALANCGPGKRGMIHATAALAERWMNTTAVMSVHPADWCFGPAEIPGCRILVTGGRGDIIISGSGYPGTGPLGQPTPGPNEAWAYATGLVHVKLGEPHIYPDTMSEALDRATNTVTVRAETTAVAVWDLCCSFAVLVDLCGVG